MMGGRLFQFLALVNFCISFARAGKTHSISVSEAPPVNASAPIPEAFVSFSIEFVYFPDFAGVYPQTLALQ